MTYFLAKTDPDTYSVADFARDKRTTWDGVTNPMAAKTISSMAKGDIVFLYHSQGESAIVGLAHVDSAPRLDPKNPKSWVVDMKFIQPLNPPTTLREIKDSHLFEDFALVRNSRLSTMACPENFVAWLRPRYPKAKF
ncbi:MAG: EVE domain-containing protein [Acidobacteria bacterium]|nr:EVE domain-containing protein [Acidobacteriota bacterium]